MRRIFLTFLAFSIAIAPCAHGLPERPIGVDVGIGAPQLAVAEIQLNLFNLIQAGLGYGLLPPGPLVPSFPLPSTSYTLSNGSTYSLNPSITPSASALSPFVRVFLGPRDFYIQYTHTLYILGGELAADLQDPLSGITLPNVLSGTLTLTQWMPTLSIGRLYSTKLFYFNLSLGATLVSTLSSDFAASVSLPAVVGGNASNQAASDAMKTQVQQEVDRASAQIKTSFPILPSLFFAMGFYL